MEAMDTDPRDQHNRNPLSPQRIHQSSFSLKPVSPEAAGEGLPYAPENWPEPGDVWGWKVGKRVANTGHYLDRYLYLPKSCHPQGSSRKKYGFASKLSVHRYIQEAFPNADVNAFFSSFIWKIPAKHFELNNEGVFSFPLQLDLVAEPSDPDAESESVSCKAGNKMCSSLLFDEVENSSTMPCDICCNEPRFCRDCCCILCCKLVDSAYGGYSHIKCLNNVGDDTICGHIAHMDCALRSHLAGTVGGVIGLDAEYYCRRCDGKTDLIPHVKKLIEKCDSIDSRDDLEKIFNLSFCLLCGSKKPAAKKLLSRIELAISKIKRGSLEDIGKVNGGTSAVDEAGLYDNGNATMEGRESRSPLDFSAREELHRFFINQSESAKLEEEIDQVLESLRKSQDVEYSLAKERLHAQKTYLCNLYQQLELEKCELACRTSMTSPDALVRTVTDRKDQIERELVIFRDMEKVAQGFGKTPKDILKKHFNLNVEEDYNEFNPMYDGASILS